MAATAKGEEAVIEFGYGAKGKLGWKRPNMRARLTSDAMQLWISLNECEA